MGVILKFVCLPASSPIGEVFRARLRQFPSLVTCCTIDWFSAWPQEALQSVAASFLNELPELDASPVALRGMVRESLSFCVCIYVYVLAAYNHIPVETYCTSSLF